MKEYIKPNIEFVIYNSDCLSVSDEYTKNGENNVDVNNSQDWNDDFI